MGNHGCEDCGDRLCPGFGTGGCGAPLIESKTLQQKLRQTRKNTAKMLSAWERARARRAKMLSEHRVFALRVDADYG